MISIFNGRERGLGSTSRSVYIQLNVQFRKHLHELKGPPLAVFLAVALHSDRDGWAWPSRRLLARETGYTIDTISRAITTLCNTTIDNHRILLRYQNQGNGEFKSNRYLIFPTQHEIMQYEGHQPELLNSSNSPCSVSPYTATPCTAAPCTATPCTAKQVTKENHPEEAPKSLKGEPSQQATTDPLWKSVLQKLKLQMTQATYDTWLKQTTAKRTDHTITITCHTAYAQDWLKNRLDSTIQRTINRLAGEPLEVVYITEEQ